MLVLVGHCSVVNLVLHFFFDSVGNVFSSLCLDAHLLLNHAYFPGSLRVEIVLAQFIHNRLYFFADLLNVGLFVLDFLEQLSIGGDSKVFIVLVIGVLELSYLKDGVLVQRNELALCQHLLQNFINHR